MTQALKRVITGRQYFTLIFGSIVGVTWMIILGHLVGDAGPLGTILALLAGAFSMCLVALCYAEISSVIPAAGGEIAYAYEISGVRGTYVVGWAMALIYVATSIFESISLGWITNLLIPGIRGPVVYEMFGEPIHLGGLLIGLGATLVLGGINMVGAHATARVQEILTYLRLTMIVAFIGVGVIWGEAGNLEPLFRPDTDGTRWIGILGVLTTAPFWYAGLSVFAPAIEEKSPDTSARSVMIAIVGGVLAAALFYCLLVVAVSMLLPWQRMVTLELPAATVFEAALQSTLLTKVVLLTALLGNITAWNGLIMAGSRVLFALGRSRVMAPGFGAVHARYRTPARSIAFMIIVTMIGTFLGKGFILPIVNIASAGFALTYAVTCLAVIRTRRRDPHASRPFAVPGGIVTAWIAFATSVAILGVALMQPYLALPAPGMPAEWLVIILWSAIGLVLWYGTRGVRATLSEDQRRAVLMGAGEPG